MIKAVLFDLEGTVTDTEQFNHRGYAYAAKQIGVEMDMAEVLVTVTGMNYHDIGLYLREKYGADFPYERYMEIRKEYIDRQVRLYGIPLKAGVPKVLDDLRDLGYTVVLVSSTGIVRVNEFLAPIGGSTRFDAVIAGDSVAHSKPAPDIYLRAAQKLGVAPSECAVIEDSRNGILAGYRAGMKVVMVPDRFPCTKELEGMLWHCIGSLEELVPLIQSEGCKS